MKKQHISTFFIIAGSLLLLLMTYFMFFGSLNNGKTYVNIDADDNVDSVIQKLNIDGTQKTAFLFLSAVLDYSNHIRTGHYETSNQGLLKLARKLRNGQQTPVRITIPSVRTQERLAAELSTRLMLDSTEILHIMKDSASCAVYGLDTANIISLFLPNTYEMYWNTTVEKLFKRMKKESDTFWNADRLAQAEKAGLSPTEVITLASIIDEETANNKEKPMIAGMYLNRLHIDMPLQADPTIKFALKDFGLRRIYTNLTFIDSPYNTYRNIGLPPGPIRIPSKEGIEAVLHFADHEYIYMCAKEDFSGTHNFAKTYKEHLQNAKRYTDALNERGIK